MIWEKGGFRVSSQREDVDMDVLYNLLKDSYWAKDRPRKAVEKSVQTSLCFSLLRDQEQIGFARVLTDKMAYAIILDMIIEKAYRGQGLGKWLLTCICNNHPEIKHLRQVLWTGSAEDFYQQAGFKEMQNLMFMSRNWKM